MNRCWIIVRLLMLKTLLFREGVSYSKLNKKALDALCRGGALDNIVDDRFTGTKAFLVDLHVVDRPKSLKKFAENLELYIAQKGDFTEEEIIQFKTDLTGIFPDEPWSLVRRQSRKLQDKFVPAYFRIRSESLQLCWFIPRKIVPKKTKNGKLYWIVEVIDSNNELTKIRCWGVKPEKDRIHLNRPYMANLKYDPNWGFSTYAIGRTFRQLG